METESLWTIDREPDTNILKFAGELVIVTVFIGSQKDSEEVYRNDRLSREQNWWKSGNPAYDIHYKDGRRHGKFTQWTHEGKKVREGNYINGMRKGVWGYWNNDGSYREVNFRN